MKVAILTNIPAPYRIPLWQKLSEVADITILYTSVNDSFKRKWKIDFGTGYKYKTFTNSNDNVCSEYSFKVSLLYHLIKTGYDILFIGGYGNINNVLACIISKVLAKKVVLLWDGGFKSKENYLKKAVKILFYRFFTDAFCVSGSNAIHVLKEYEKNDQKYFNVYFTCDVDYYYKKYIGLKDQKQLLKSKYGLEKYEKIILYVGRIDEKKGIQDLILACKGIRSENVCVLIVGNGPYKIELDQLVVENSLNNIFFAGFVDMNTTPEYYTMSDLLVLPTYSDTWGLVVNEAMACGLPVISTTKAGVSYDLIKEDENGYIIEPGDVKALSSKIERIISDDYLWERLSKKSFEIILQWTNTQSVQGFDACFDYLKKKFN